MRAIKRTQLPARRMPRKANGTTRAEPITISRQRRQQRIDFADDLRHRRLRRQRVLREHNIEATPKRPTGDERKILLAACLPVATVYEHENRRVRPHARKPVETL